MPKFQPNRNVLRFHSQSGAFDLPSILVGVVVVGILTAGVFAAIFGVIPFAQDRAAKQDLAAINTAQGVTYAKDGQRYKDIDALSEAALLSGLNPETTEIRVEPNGQGFTAITDSSTGTRWYITHDDNVPREWDEPAAGDGPSGAGPDYSKWASAKCTPPVVNYLKLSLEANTDPRMREITKSLKGDPSADRLLAEAWTKERMLPLHELEATLSGPEFVTIMDLDASGLPNPHSMPLVEDGWEEWRSGFVTEFDAGVTLFCHQ